MLNGFLVRDIAETDLAIVPVDPARRTDVKWGVGQPRDGVLAIQFEDPTGIRGGVKFKTLASATGIDIITVVDGSCQPITSYGNIRLTSWLPTRCARPGRCFRQR